MSDLQLNVVYSGKIPETDAEKAIRRVLKLPVKKALVYYKDVKDSASVIDVEQFEVTEKYDITDFWCTLRIKLADGTERNIHSSYLSEMQKSTFIADMEKQIES